MKIGEAEQALTCVYMCYVYLGVEEASSLVEPQRGNEKNKQSLPVPLWPEISNTLIPPTITTSAREEEQHNPVHLPTSGPEPGQKPFFQHPQTT